MAVYLDHNASNLIDPRLLDHFITTLRETHGNAGSPHGAGRQARALIEKAREELAETFGFEIANITFCSSGTEALNLALQRGFDWQPGDHLLYSAVEHKAVIESVKFLKERFRISADEIPVNPHGQVNAAIIKRMVTDRTRLCAVMAANNEVGTVQPLRSIRDSLPEQVLLLVDGVQAAGRLNIDDIVADILVVSSHKMRAPKGAAGLLTRPTVTLSPLLHGGSQERGRRAGTEDTAAISTLGRAAQLVRQATLCDVVAMKQLRDRFEAQLKEHIPGLMIQGAEVERLPQTSNVIFPGWTAEKLITALDLRGFHVSSGSACTSGSLLPSHVLLAMGFSEDEARSALRISFGPETAQEQLQAAASVLADIVGR
jgi:cysteine desulfurase